MKRLLWIVPAILIFCVSAKAQNVPAWEVYGGYTYMRANLGGTSFNLNGGGGSVSENLNNWFGGRFEVNAVGATIHGTNVSVQTYTYGPVVTYRRFDRLTPFAHLQLGAVHASPGYLGISEGAFKFALAGGGGADFALSERAAIRVQADYLMTQFLNQRQDNIQLSTGLVIRFGRK
jgi:Outer membrane protein beta-barrel domain